MKFSVSWSCRNGSLLFTFAFPNLPQFHITEQEIDLLQTRVPAGKAAPAAVNDLTRLILCDSTRIQVITREDPCSSTGTYSYTAKVDVIWIDTRRMFKRVRERAQKLLHSDCRFQSRFDSDPKNWDYRAEFRLSSFEVRHPPYPKMKVMEIIASSSDAFHRASLAKSLASFGRKLTRENWSKLLDDCSRMLSQNAQLTGGGSEEISFRWLGMNGALILRGDSYSSHT